MKNNFIFSVSILALLTLTSCQTTQAQSGMFAKDLKVQQILYFNPEVYPDIEEIKDPTYSAFFSAVSDRISKFRNYKMLRVDSFIPFDSVDHKTISEFCKNNHAQFAVVPKVKYFKVGIGKYVFSNQVIVSMKIFDADGNFLTETDYDTYKKNARMLGSAENSIKIGTVGAMKSIRKNLNKGNSNFVAPVEY